MKKIEHQKKRYEEYNAIDLRNFWCEQYKKIHGKDFESKNFIGNELSALKKLQKDYDVFSILVGITKAIKNGAESIVYFSYKIDSFVPNTDNSKLDFFISVFGDKEHIQKRFDYMMLSTEWFPSADSKKKKEQLEKELYSWVESL